MKRAGIDRIYVGGVKQDGRNVAPENIVKLAKALAVKPGDLFHGFLLISREPVAHDESRNYLSTALDACVGWIAPVEIESLQDGDLANLYSYLKATRGSAFVARRAGI